MSLTSRKIHTALKGGLFVGGCLLSFLGGRWSGPQLESSVVLSETVDRGYSRSIEYSLDDATPAYPDFVEDTESVLDNWIGDDRFYPAQLEDRKSELSAIAERDVSRAELLAREGRTPMELEAFRLAVLEGLARVDWQSAMQKAMDLPDETRESALNAVFAGGVQRPEIALREMKAFEESGVLSGQALARARMAFVSALGKEGRFGDAVGYAFTLPPGREREGLLTSNFATWGRYEPEFAVSAAMDLENTQERQQAYHVVTAAWGESNPEGLANFAIELPQGGERSMALDKALGHWVSADPSAAAEWLDQRESAAEFDDGVLALATHPYFAERNPRRALTWAEALWDDNLRADTIGLVIKQWAATDRNAAVEYVKNSRELGIAERQELLSLFGEPKRFGIDGPLP